VTGDRKESNNVGKRLVRKPRKRRGNAVEVGSTEILGARNWRRESLHRQGWRGHLKEAKS
jgi:hypothetical protein